MVLQLVAFAGENNNRQQEVISQGGGSYQRAKSCHPLPFLCLRVDFFLLLDLVDNLCQAMRQFANSDHEQDFCPAVLRQQFLATASRLPTESSTSREQELSASVNFTSPCLSIRWLAAYHHIARALLATVGLRKHASGST